MGTCNAGICQVAGKPCNDDDPCTFDFCNPVTGQCATSPVPTCDDTGCTEPVNEEDDPIGCDDGDLCTEAVCVSGSCAFTNLKCNDFNPCTVDSCDPESGCVFTQIPNCGGCTNDLQCENYNPCDVDTCDVATGQCIHIVDTSCQPCTKENEVIDCFDNDQCTIDICQQSGTCFYLPSGTPECQSSGCFNDVDCIDSDSCTLDICNSGTCEHITTPCADGEPCTVDGPELCITTLGCITDTDTTCGGLVCAFDSDCPYTDLCLVPKCEAAQCSFTIKDCDDNDPSTRDVCSSETGECIHEPYAPGNWTGCTVDEDCAPDNACYAGICNENGQCAWSLNPCNDFDPCTVSTCDSVTGCTHVTDDSCTGCTSNAGCDDGDFCTTDLCTGGSCTFEPAGFVECGGTNP